MLKLKLNLLLWICVFSLGGYSQTTLDKETINQKLAKAEAAYSKGNYILASELYEELYRYNQLDDLGIFCLAESNYYQNKEKRRQARLYYSKLIGTDLYTSLACVRIAHIYLEYGDLNSTKEYLDKAFAAVGMESYTKNDILHPIFWADYYETLTLYHLAKKDYRFGLEWCKMAVYYNLKLNYDEKVKFESKDLSPLVLYNFFDNLETYKELKGSTRLINLVGLLSESIDNDHKPSCYTKLAAMLGDDDAKDRYYKNESRYLYYNCGF